MKHLILLKLTSILLFLVVPKSVLAQNECQRTVNAFSKMAKLINEGMVRESGAVSRYIWSNRKENTPEQAQAIYKTYSQSALELSLSALGAYEKDLCKTTHKRGDGLLSLTNTNECNNIAFWLDFLEFNSEAVQKDFYAAIKEMWLISGGEVDPEKRDWTDCQLKLDDLKVDRVRKN